MLLAVVLRRATGGREIHGSCGAMEGDKAGDSAWFAVLSDMVGGGLYCIGELWRPSKDALGAVLRLAGVFRLTRSLYVHVT